MNNINNSANIGGENAPIYNNIAIALKFKTFSQICRDLENVMKRNVNLVEIRFDYSKKLHSFFSEKSSISNENEILLSEIESIFPKKEINSLKKPLKIPIIFTLRASDEGGNCTLPEISRLKIIKYLMNFEPDYFDIESKIDITSLNDLYLYASKNKIKIIYSHHNWINTPAFGKIRELVQNIILKCPGIEPKRDLDQNIIKVILTANHLSDNYTALEICKIYAKKGYKIICFCMGADGIPSRVGSLLCGAFLSYASFSNQTAPGQLNIEEFIEYYELIKHKNDKN